MAESNVHFAEAESLNYDYLPGEPQSRRTWYITLRRPVEPEGALRRDMLLRFHSSHHPNTLLPDDRIFLVEDIHGRNVVVVPISDAHGRPGGMRLTNYEDHRTPYPRSLTNYEDHRTPYPRTYNHR